MQKMRKIIKIDEEKCTGCGLCASACAEGAIRIVDGKAKLVSDIYCDGLGACIGECPEGALTIEEREAAEFDEEATKIHLQRLAEREKDVPRACPGSMMRNISRHKTTVEQAPVIPVQSELTNWPVQLTLAPTGAPYFRNADLLLVADCVPFALADFHSRFLKGKPVVIGCPKLDDGAYYVEKLADIIKRSEINSITVVHMEVPCCSGLTYIASKAIQLSEADVPLNDITISIQGEVLAEEFAQN